MTDFGAAILEGIQQLDARFDRFEARQERLEARQERVENDLKGIRADLEGIRADLDHLRARFDALPDFDLMMVRGEVILRKINEIEHSLVDLRARLSEVYGAMATDAEINIFRHELKAYREAALANEIRLATLERHILKQPQPAT